MVWTSELPHAMGYTGRQDCVWGVESNRGFSKQICLEVSRGLGTVRFEPLFDLVPVDAVPEGGEVLFLAHDAVIVQPGVFVDADVQERVELLADLVGDA